MKLRQALLVGLLALSAPLLALAADAPALPKTPLPYGAVQAKPQPKAPASVAKPAAPLFEKSGPRPLPPAELEAFVDGWMDAAMSREHVAGAAIGIVQNGKVIVEKGYGFADVAAGRRVDPRRTLFRIGSISKTFTWILLMKEVEAGRIRLDQPINNYLPARARVRGDGMARPVTVANLMDHTGGFEDRALGQLFERNPSKVRPLELYLRQEKPRRVREPGVLSVYSNYGAALAGEATVFVSGKVFERRVEEEIARPLGMTRTTFREPRPAWRGLPRPMPEALRPDISQGYRWTPAGFQKLDYEFIGQIAPAGAGSSTAADMSRYMMMLLGDGSWNGTTVFGPAAARAFRTPMRKTPPGINGWAHGFAVYALPGGHTGFGHDGSTLAFHSTMVVVPDLGLGVFVATNSAGGAALARDLPGQLLRRFYAAPAPAPRHGSEDLANNAAAYDGVFVQARRASGGLEGFVDLFSAAAALKVTPDGKLVTAGAEGVRTWVPDGPLGEGQFVEAAGDGRLAVTLRDGRAALVRDGLNATPLLPASPWLRADIVALLAGLAGLAAVATLAGVPLRHRRDPRENPTQARAGMVQNIQACLWLGAIALFALWAQHATADPGYAMFRWPGPLVVTASACALVAATFTLATAAALPAIWQGGRRVDSWPASRKLAFTLTVAIYAAFTVELALAGALAPWDS